MAGSLFMLEASSESERLLGELVPDVDPEGTDTTLLPESETTGGTFCCFVVRPADVLVFGVLGLRLRVWMFSFLMARGLGTCTHRHRTAQSWWS